MRLRRRLEFGEPRLDRSKGLFLHGSDGGVDVRVRGAEVRAVETVAEPNRARSARCVRRGLGGDGRFAPRVTYPIDRQLKSGGAENGGMKYARLPLAKNSLSMLTFQPAYALFTAPTVGTGGVLNFSGK